MPVQMERVLIQKCLRMHTERPDIIWIVTTQWRAQACGYVGDPNACTPGLDALAAESVNYAQAVTPHPFGPFARAALLTGVPSPANGVRDYYDPLPVEARTIAHEMQARAYTTAFFGKWHLALRDPKAALVGETHARQRVPEERRGGFGFWEGFESGFLLNDPWLHGTRLPEPVQVKGYQSDVVCERAAQWWRDELQKPETGEGTRGGVFCIVSLEAPHPPYAAALPEGMRRRFGTDGASITLSGNVPLGGEVEAQARRELAGYYAHIEATDRAVARLVAAVDAEAMARGRVRPVVVFTSVHGDMHGAHGLFRKGWPYEESVRVPLLVREAIPGEGRGAGRRSDEAVSLLDLPAMTIAWAEGHEWRCPREWAEISMPSVVSLPHQCDRVWHGRRSATRKEVFIGESGRQQPWLCFDLKSDPLEKMSIHEGHQQVT